MKDFHIVLIRGIGAASHALITMKELESAVRKAGLADARSILATGNFVLSSKLSGAKIAAIFDQEMCKKKLERPMVLRNPAQLQELLKAGASRADIKARPSKVLVHFFAQPALKTAVSSIAAKASFEQTFMLAKELVIDFGERVSDSKLTLDFIEKCAGSTGTSRNWNTVTKLMDTAIAMGWKEPSESLDVSQAARSAIDKQETSLLPRKSSRNTGLLRP
jgi:uncharacterized protein (DUF1697 family)